MNMRKREILENVFKRDTNRLMTPGALQFPRLLKHLSEEQITRLVGTRFMNRKMQRAALIIQKAFRGFRTRKMLQKAQNKIEKAAKIIQNWWFNRRWQKLLPYIKVRVREEAAIVI